MKDAEGVPCPYASFWYQCDGPLILDCISTKAL